MEANSSIVDFMGSLKWKGKTSETNIDVQTPIGIAISKAPKVTISEPYNRGNPPNVLDARLQRIPRSNSGPNFENASAPSLATKKSIRKRMKIESEAQIKRTTVIG